MEGRIRRLTYNLRMLLLAFLSCIIIYLVDNDLVEIIPFIILLIVIQIISIIQIALRLQDRNISGLYSLTVFIPIINLWLLHLIFTQGTIGPNKYGQDPKKRNKPNLANHYSQSINNTFESNQTVSNKTELLDQAYHQKVLTKEEYEDKKKALLEENTNLEQYNTISTKLRELHYANLLTLQEYESKSKALYYEHPIEYCKDPKNHNINYYYIEFSKVHGPITYYKLVDLVVEKKLNGNSFVRTEFDKSFTIRAKEIVTQ